MFEFSNLGADTNGEKIKDDVLIIPNFVFRSFVDGEEVRWRQAEGSGGRRPHQEVDSASGVNTIKTLI